MAMMMEVEDDVFFADLNRQISLLITDDDEDADDINYNYNYNYPPVSSYPAVSIQQAFPRTAIFRSTQSQAQYKFDDQLSYKTSTADQSKGTGVFIPKSSQWISRSKRSNNKKHQTKNTTNNYYVSYNNNNNNENRQQLQVKQAASAASKSNRFLSGH